MRATLLLATLLFGAPVLPDDPQQDPASEAPPAQPGLAEFAGRILELSAPLIRCTDRGEFFATLDLAVLRLDVPAAALATLAEAALRDAALDLDRLRDEALHAFEAAVSPVWRARLRAGVEQAALKVHIRPANPALFVNLHALTAEEVPTFHERLGDPRRALAQRRADLQYLRGVLCAGALAAAADRGEHLPDQLAELIVPLWRGTLRQFEAILQTGSVPTVCEDVHPDSSPVAELMLRYQCRHGERIAACLRADPALTDLLLELHEKLLRRFPPDAIAAITLGPTWSADDAEEAGLIAAIHTAQDLASGEASLERLDREWWLERSLRSTTRVVVDIRFV